MESGKDFGTFAVLAFAVAATSMRFGRGNNIASLGCQGSAFLPHEEKAVAWQPGHFQAAFERIAAKRVDLLQPTGVDDDPALTAILIVEEVEQLPGRSSVEIAFGLYMQGAVVLVECNLEWGVHVVSFLYHACLACSFIRFN